MTITKFTTKSLVLNKDLEYNQQIGLPVEVFCMVRHQTIAFGRIQNISEGFVQINEQMHCREKNAFFGCPCPYD